MLLLLGFVVDVIARATTTTTTTTTATTTLVTSVTLSTGDMQSPSSHVIVKFWDSSGSRVVEALDPGDLVRLSDLTIRKYTTSNHIHPPPAKEYYWSNQRSSLFILHRLSSRKIPEAFRPNVSVVSDPSVHELILRSRSCPVMVALRLKALQHQQLLKQQQQHNQLHQQQQQGVSSEYASAPFATTVICTVVELLDNGSLVLRRTDNPEREQEVFLCNTDSRIMKSTLDLVVPSMAPSERERARMVERIQLLREVPRLYKLDVTIVEDENGFARDRVYSLRG